MNLDEDMGGGGFKFKKRDKKNRIKTPSEKPEEPEEVTVQASLSVTEAINQAQQHVQRRPSLEHPPSAEDKKDEDGTPNTAEAKKTQTEDGGLKDDREENGAKEPEEPNPTAGSIDLNEPPELDGEPSCAAKGADSKKGPRFKQRKKSRDFKSRPPKKGVLGFGDDIPGMDGLGSDITVICPWEAFSHLELHELAQFGII